MYHQTKYCRVISEEDVRGMLQEAVKAFATQLSLYLLGRTDRTKKIPAP